MAEICKTCGRFYDYRCETCFPVKDDIASLKMRLATAEAEVERHKRAVDFLLNIAVWIPCSRCKYQDECKRGSEHGCKSTLLNYAYAAQPDEVGGANGEVK